jgi:hypothetical protein
MIRQEKKYASRAKNPFDGTRAMRHIALIPARAGQMEGEMKNKHTPGPWGLIKWRDEPGWRLTPPDGRCVCFGVLPDEDDEDNANARLIAADDGYGAYDTEIDAATDIIAKAEGR